jgi:hypothetical protein
MSYHEHEVDEEGNPLIVDHFHKIDLDIIQLILADFCAGSVLITFGVVLGKIGLF